MTQIQERIVEHLFRVPKPHTFYELHDFINDDEDVDAVLPHLAGLRATGVVQRIVSASSPGQLPRYTLTVSTWLRLARAWAMVREKRCLAEGRESAGSIPACSAKDNT